MPSTIFLVKMLCVFSLENTAQYKYIMGSSDREDDLKKIPFFALLKRVCISDIKDFKSFPVNLCF